MESVSTQLLSIGHNPETSSHKSMSFGVVLRRFKDLFMQVLAQHHVKADVVSGLRHASTLGFGGLAGVSAARNCSALLQILSWCLSISRQLHSLNSKFRASEADGYPGKSR